VITGGLPIGYVTAVDVAPAQGFETVIDAVPPVAIRVDGTVAVSCVAETKVVASAAPFQFTVEPETKFVPFTVNVNCGPPAAAQVGLSELIVGTALIVITSVALPVLQELAPLLALIVTLVVPAVVGVPEITFLLKDKPGGNGAAVYVLLLSVLVAVIV
jgi:hypothetical protein